MGSEFAAARIAGAGKPQPRVRLLATALLLLLAGCGGGDDLTSQAAEGRILAESKGCVACHGSKGEGGVGPAWIGLAGTEVALEDGTTVVADAEYLRRSIVAPDSQIVAGYTIQMPKTELAESEVAALVAYIEELR